MQARTPTLTRFFAVNELGSHAAQTPPGWSTAAPKVPHSLEHCLRRLIVSGSGGSLDPANRARGCGGSPTCTLGPKRALQSGSTQTASEWQMQVAVDNGSPKQSKTAVDGATLHVGSQIHVSDSP